MPRAACADLFFYYYYFGRKSQCERWDLCMQKMATRLIARPGRRTEGVPPNLARLPCVALVKVANGHFHEKRPREKNPTRATFTTDVEPIPTRHPRPPPAPFLSTIFFFLFFFQTWSSGQATGGRKAGIRPSGQGRRRLAITTTKPSKSSLPNRARGNTNPPAFPTHVRYI
jgi:hypothetical protein